MKRWALLVAILYGAILCLLLPPAYHLAFESQVTPAPARIFFYRVWWLLLSVMALWQGALLAVPQFTLAADTARGMRPGFSTAAAPEQARALFDYLVQRSGERHHRVASGDFGAHMQLSLINDGPVTFWLET